MNEIVDNWNRTHFTDIAKATMIHIVQWREEIYQNVRHGTNTEQY